MNLLLKKSNQSQALIDRRSFERVSTNIDARFFYCNLFYSARVLNVSKQGMFINTKRRLPSDAMFIIIIRVDNKAFKVVAKVKRISKHDNSFNGIGVELVKPSQYYRDYVDKLRNMFCPDADLAIKKT